MENPYGGGVSLDLNNPRTYNEKLQWLKLNDRRPEYTMMVDKLKVRDFVKKKIGEEYLISLLGSWRHPEDIDFDLLPDQFVLKCNHNSGKGMCICKDKSKLNLKKVRKDLAGGLKENFFYAGREWPYKDVPRRIIAETYMEDDTTHDLRDYKFFCFDGVVKMLFVASDRDKGEHAVKFDFFDENYNHLDIINGHPNADVPPAKPRNFELMRALAEKLSEGIPEVRIDLYECNGKVYFGEMTFFHWGGMVKFEPDKWDYILGDHIKLPEKRNKTSAR